MVEICSIIASVIRSPSELSRSMLTAAPMPSTTPLSDRIGSPSIPAPGAVIMRIPTSRSAGYMANRFRADRSSAAVDETSRPDGTVNNRGRPGEPINVGMTCCPTFTPRLWRNHLDRYDQLHRERSRASVIRQWVWYASPCRPFRSLSPSGP